MLNKAILVGRLTADPELRQTPNGISVTSFSIACDRPYTSKDAGKVTDFIDIVAWRSTAEFVTRYFRKGSAIGIDGRIQVRDYTDKNGNKRKAVEVLAENVSFVERKGAQSDTVAPAAPSGNVSYASGNAGDFEDLEDDSELPF